MVKEEEEEEEEMEEQVHAAGEIVKDPDYSMSAGSEILAGYGTDAYNTQLVIDEHAVPKEEVVEEETVIEDTVEDSSAAAALVDTDDSSSHPQVNNLRM